MVKRQPRSCSVKFTETVPLDYPVLHVLTDRNWATSAFSVGCRAASKLSQDHWKVSDKPIFGWLSEHFILRWWQVHTSMNWTYSSLQMWLSCLFHPPFFLRISKCSSCCVAHEIGCIYVLGTGEKLVGFSSDCTVVIVKVQGQGIDNLESNSAARRWQTSGYIKDAPDRNLSRLTEWGAQSRDTPPPPPPHPSEKLRRKHFIC